MSSRSKRVPRPPVLVNRSRHELRVTLGQTPGGSVLITIEDPPPPAELAQESRADLTPSEQEQLEKLPLAGNRLLPLRPLASLEGPLPAGLPNNAKLFSADPACPHDWSAHRTRAGWMQCRKCFAFIGADS